ncbi:hypothetical protein KSP39_PZI016960 [Platanthera zijinensis]|uniref:RRM domain-containing protein n=1 Tax=Platanthera zijinensis TaxID=2320716 RepID=A0AAP0B874_9ASPA
MASGEQIDGQHTERSGVSSSVFFQDCTLSSARVRAYKFAMTGYDSSSNMTRDNDLAATLQSVDSYINVPPHMREYYHFVVLLSNLNHATTTELLKSLFHTLSGFLHASIRTLTVHCNINYYKRFVQKFKPTKYLLMKADVNTTGNPTGTGELIFAEEASMQSAANVIHGQIIDGRTISAHELRLLDVKPEYYEQCINYNIL